MGPVSQTPFQARPLSLSLSLRWIKMPTLIRASECVPQIGSSSPIRKCNNGLWAFAEHWKPIQPNFPVETIITWRTWSAAAAAKVQYNDAFRGVQSKSDLKITSIIIEKPIHPGRGRQEQGQIFELLNCCWGRPERKACFLPKVAKVK